MNRKLLLIPLIPLVALVTSACASAQAKGKPEERPALMVPPPPPRVIEPAPELTPEPVAELPATPTPPPSRPARPPARDTGPKPEAKPADPKPVEPPPVEPPPPVAPAAQLRTPQTADTSAAKVVRTTIDTARGMLNTVNFGPLSNELKKAYNDAKLFLQQAEDALKEGNLELALAVAKKAETLAKVLAER